MDIRQFFTVQTSSKTTSLAGGLKKSSGKAVDDGKAGSKQKSKDGQKRRSSKTSDSEGEASKASKRKAHRKKTKVVLESDSSEEEPLPTKLRKKSQDSGKKKAKREKTAVISSDEEDALPPRLQKTAKHEKQTKEPEKSPRVAKKSPVKVVANVSEYFGRKPVERTIKKTQKRKERSEDIPEHRLSNNNVERVTEQKLDKNAETSLEQPAKKAKKSSVELAATENSSQERTKKHNGNKIEKEDEEATVLKTSSASNPSSTAASPVLTPSKTRRQDSDATKTSPAKSTSTEISKDATSSKSTAHNRTPCKSSEPTTPSTSFTPSAFLTPSKSLTPSKTATVTSGSKKPSSSGTSVTPEKKANVDVVPSSLERRSSGYRNFMNRVGPQALGSKEIPQGSESCLAGKVFVVTGVLESIERDDAIDCIKRHGGKVTQAVSKKTTYLVVGRDPGMSKIEKAKQVGTKQIDEDGLFDLIRASQPAATKNEETEESSQDRGSSQLTERSGSQTSVDFSPYQRNRSQSSAMSSASSTPATQTPTASPVPEGVSSESLLWVDKYKPRTIKAIIGQQGDRSNVKKLLRWLQNWQDVQKSGKQKGGVFAGKEDGSIFKAALLSGPPGVGKTTSAHLVCKEVGFSFVEFNASDSRSKKTLEQHVAELLNNKTMDGYFGRAGATSTSSKHVLIMDEVDGMAGNEDRGGMQELINLIKSTKIPIICMCNDRNSQKVRSLANYCFDLRFQKPRVEQIKGAMMSIAFKEHLTISPQAMEQVIVGANQDVRQVLHNLAMWTSKQKSMSYDEAKADANRAHKDIKLGPFDVTRKIFSAEENSRMKIQDRFSLFFNDYSLIPLFSQQNYLQAVPYSASGDMKKTLKCISDAAESYCNSDLVEKCIRSNGSWNLLPLQAFFSCVLPGATMRGRMGQRIEFPSWLGKNSTTTKNSRVLQDLVSHAQLSISGSKNELNLDYITHFRNVLSRPLINATSEDCSSRVSEVISLMDSYHFIKEDWESILDVGQFEGTPKLQAAIDSKVKAAFTRTYNKASHLTPFASNVAAKKKGRQSAAELETWGLETSETVAAASSESDDDIAHNPMIKVKKNTKAGGRKSGKTPATSDAKPARGKGPGKGKSKKPG